MSSSRDLKILQLHYVAIKGKKLVRILSELPILENLHLVRCRKLRVAKIFGQRLKTVILGANKELKTIDLETPSLNNIIFTCPKKPCVINIAGCHDLRHLLLHGLVIRDEEFHEFISKFPLLKYLRISACHKLQRLNISSQNLKILHITGGLRLRAIHVDTPSLSSFCVTGCQVLNSIVGCQIDVQLEEKCKRKNACWVQRLEEFLEFYIQVDDEEILDFLIDFIEDDM